MAKPRAPETVCISTRIDLASRKRLELLCEIDALNTSGFIARAVNEAIGRRLRELGRGDEARNGVCVPHEALAEAPPTATA
jgi:hypothetical protein